MPVYETISVLSHGIWPPHIYFNFRSMYFSYNNIMPTTHDTYVTSYILVCLAPYVHTRHYTIYHNTKYIFDIQRKGFILKHCSMEHTVLFVWIHVLVLQHTYKFISISMLPIQLRILGKFRLNRAFYVEDIVLSPPYYHDSSQHSPYSKYRKK